VVGATGDVTKCPFCDPFTFSMFRAGGEVWFGLGCHSFHRAAQSESHCARATNPQRQTASSMRIRIALQAGISAPTTATASRIRASLRSSVDETLSVTGPIGN
jgi:hypothetical protein